MSDPLLAFTLSLAILLFMAAWVPFLDFLQRIIRKYRDTTAAASPRLRTSRRSDPLSPLAVGGAPHLYIQPRSPRGWWATRKASPPGCRAH